MFRPSARYILATTALVWAVSTSALAATMDYLGAWSNTATYATGKVIVYNKAIYYSLKSTLSAPNKNYVPSSNPTWWAQVGTVGNTILSGIGNPTSQNLGQVGDFYINTATNMIFGPKAAISPFWPATGVSLQGPKGDAGAVGVMGPTGPQGATGTQGATGLQGAPGVQGATGPQGSVGPQGAQGLQGVQGTKGETGDKGDSGAKGDTGPVAPGSMVVDARGDAIGHVLDQQNTELWVLMQFDGIWTRVLLGRSGFYTEGNSGNPYTPGEYYTELNCAGTNYMAAESFPPVAFVSGPGGLATNATAYYPKPPYAEMTFKSTRSMAGQPCYNNGSTLIVGEPATTPLSNFQAPFELK